MALGESNTNLDGLRVPEHLGKRDYTDYDQNNAYLYDESRDDEDSPDPRRPGRKKDPNEPETKRRAQNRAAQRAFRERKERHLKDLETRVHELEQSARSWQNSNLMLRTKLSALEDELEHYRAGHVPSGGFDKSVPPVIAQSNVWPAASLDLDPLGDLQGPASVLPARNPSITGLHGPATVLPSVGTNRDFETQFWNNQMNVPPSLNGLNASSTLSSTSTPRSMPSEFGGSIAPSLDPLMMGQAPPLVDLTTSSASSASSDQSLWEGSKFCEQLQKAACPLPKLPLASATPQIVPLTNDWERQNPLELSFGYREPTPQEGVPSNFVDLLGNDYGFFDPLDDPLKPIEDPLKPLDDPLQPLGSLQTAHDSKHPLSVPSDFGSPPMFREPAIYPLGLTPSSTGGPLEFTKEETLSPAENPAFHTPRDGGDEVPAKSKKYMTCQAVWDRICSHPNFEGINLDELCSEFQAKARCSDSGVVLTEEDVDSVLKSVPRRQTSA
ncbi:AP-1-like transcription factor [Wickerhamiella sorbophila]|uniref:AP-1-like transcription factor n=1 Tax=Wickerhamiella sorbophila TaxID=45607 RepID=A0A2T0FFL9_9ASCO|nr:AP-1-like transcription factor [Wickerhamiella sorbophila]PRT53793.1 AP-1-like transcription factor [Wickerhamiella sorbophila]